MSLPSLIDLPAELNALVEHSLQGLRARLDDAGQQALAAWPAARHAALARALGASDFVAELAVRDAAMLLELAESGELERALGAGELRDQLAAALEGCASEDDLARRLRRYRNRQQTRIIWRDVNRLADLAATCRDLSDLADASIDLAYRWLYAQQCAQSGTPIGARSGEAQHLVILGMGKLGAFELNLSSDIDLIFAYPEGGETTGARRSLDNQEFFTRVGQKLIKALDALTVDGFVFRVDMRLRPYGSGGPLVYSFNAMEQYYQDQGRDWERYAMIKARVVAGDQAAGAQLQQMLRPFVYRRYLDFSAIEALRSMKQLIQQEVRRKGMTENIKLGAGGIREVEFIAQAFQLIHGGRDLSLQQRPLLKVLDTLAGQGYLPPPVVDELKDGYRFLRYLEHALQAIADRQTQMLPDGELERARVAFIMGFPGWNALLDQLAHWRGRIDWHFRQVIADPDEDGGASLAGVGDEWLPLWQGALEPEAAQHHLADAGFADPASAWQRLEGLLHGSQVRAMQRLGRERLDAFMPGLLAAMVAHGNPDLLLERVLPLVEAVARRSAYLVLLSENPGALARLLTLCAASPWVAEQIARYPLLLDELLNEGRLYSPPGKDELAAELRERLTRIPEDDLEQQMEALRHFKLAHGLRVAASEIAGSLPLMKVSDYLTWLAEAILEQVLQLAWRQVGLRHGYPRRGDGSSAGEPEFVIVGYGKVGGIELGHSSDLDLVFIHNGDQQHETDGAKPIDSAQFYTRLGQRIIHLLTAQTASGALYEVDMRLRPSGAAGLLASSLAAFERYQEGEAWTWEHQALVRARVLAGSAAVGARFEAIRAQVLGRERDGAALRAEVSEMRAKMRDNLGSKATAGGTAAEAFDAAAAFDLKHDAGGIVDIEFMVQYAVLAWSRQYPELLRFTDNIRILEGLERAGLIASSDVRLLQEAYKAYRAAAHRLALQKQAGSVSGDHFHEERRGVMRIWRELGLA
ncbi:bifunctional [glutamate--ammonia ligase]-adenylyl-L-tyrosine phosphorylase/[glutamate--ammonia-ligase] adenylyltransferase [Pseudomonas sp. AN-1]|uniref:bifunctional [glutamate--ammonia ligase]-adenylyl-L-tyrosine phosphorylase/[glutamate--ammonia-ligase] adenylyltransferase n=1 Tax=Pseudomonas sp. AN-1 TaxID=3096605 RepID=UPI002A6AD32F|nr:bifunctional [glutamate--ammonia ligase]-adenylyl-L-tyrosine phosphorylase/[glutamate--ammonia-ligase] adenylyltransferase [Pseudomonas sp. AN-1]WPP45208.1 bifunctional [glutamate--ammonia ligase]-adenylyl-L-tyrosine phosphorylase/[glutamate--ammonia-ligase] adenylyltransferase [Pseudomonas sp. AN-1]